MNSPIWRRALSFASLALLAPFVLLGTGEQLVRTNQNDSLACLKDFATTYGMRYRAVRLIDDPGTRRRWLLVQQFTRPEAPAMLLPIADGQLCSMLFVAESEWRLPNANHNRLVPIIRPGDSVLLSEDSPTTEARLEAIAIESAGPGQALTVRLKLGGHLLRAIAVAPGSVLLADGKGGLR